MEGELSKWTNYVMGWKTRYFILEDEVLCYYAQKGERVRGKVHLSIADIVPLQENENYFNVITGMTVIYLFAQNLEEKKKWLTALNAEKRKALLSSSKPFKKISAGKEQENFLLKQLNLSKDTLEKIRDLNDKVLRDSSIDKQRLIKALGEYKSLSRSFEQSFREIGLVVGNFTLEVRKFNSFLNGDNDMVKMYLEDAKQVAKMFKQERMNVTTSNENDLNEDIKLVKSNIRNQSYIRDEESVIFIKKPNSKEDEEEVAFYGIEELNELNESEQNHQENHYQEEKLKLSSKKTRQNYNSNNEYYTASDNLIEINETEGKAFNNVNESSSDDLDCFTAKEYKQKRVRLPVPRKKVSINFSQILKDAMGKDLSQIQMPVTMNEPVNMLQMIAEHFQYSDLLNKAAEEENSVLRLGYVAAFIASGFSTHSLRTTKFCNPIVGETYELVDNNLKVRFMAEQISLLPEISAYYAEGQGFTLLSDTNTTTSFGLNNIDFTPISRTYVTFKKFEEVVTYSQPSAVARGIIMGTMHIDAAGDCFVENTNTGERIDLKFFPEGSPKNGDVGVVEGVITNSVTGENLGKISGNRFGDFKLINKKGTTLLWKKDTIELKEEEYYFSEYTCNLNNINNELSSILPRTDCRFRTDIRSLENQDFDTCTKERDRIEQKMRERLKNKKYFPVYFTETYDDLTGELKYEYNEIYWKKRKNKEAFQDPDIF